MSISIYDGTQLRRIGGAAAAQTVDVVIIAGQSNPLGRGQASFLPPEVVNNVVPNSAIWNGSACVPTTIGTINNYPVLANGDFGPEVMLSILAGKLTGKPLYIFKYCVGNTSLTVTDTSVTGWSPERTDANSLYLDFKAQFALFKTWLQSQGLTPNYKLFCWGQGERDSGLASYPAYGRLQVQLFNGVRAMVGLPKLPIVDMLVRGEASNQPNAPAVNTAKANCAVAVGNVTFMRTLAMEDIGDDTHYNGPGQLAFGRYLYEVAYNKQFRLPTSLPPRAFQLDPSRQEGYTAGAGYMKVASVADVSGPPLPLSYSDATKLPTVLEGNFGRGKTALRYTNPNVLDRADVPIPASSFYTWYFLIGDFSNYNVDTTRILARALGNSWLFWFPPSATGPINRLHVRHGSTNFMVSSSPVVDNGPLLYVIGYGGAGGSYIRRNGVEVATSSQPVAFDLGGPLNIGNSVFSISALYGAAGAFTEKLTVAQAQVLEASLLWEYGLASLLPSSHPFKSAPPV